MYTFLGNVKKVAAGSVRFYCTSRRDDDGENSYADDPWTKYGKDQHHPVMPLFQSTKQLTHVDEDGHARMVDVSDKAWTLRRATARGRVYIGAEAARLVSDNQLSKGDVLKVAELAGISGGKLTSQLIPLCHPIALHRLRLKLELDEASHCVIIESEAVSRGPTGVEMEALTAVAVAGLTVIDMVKAVTREAEILSVQLVSKTGGTRGDYVRRSE